ncbi:hypothetical protein CEXT_397781 [Caerostris extrusa]|uniref:Uncharacterized protein n=1 Tax=Caerostris extrusa TaxID=172846 RepID=A0AAV4XT41_CAEEX|nr:hypothetical protein CEXT_397781 [Caerostris extrusa]
MQTQRASSRAVAVFALRKHRFPLKQKIVEKLFDLSVSKHRSPHSTIWALYKYTITSFFASLKNQSKHQQMELNVAEKCLSML